MNAIFYCSDLGVVAHAFSIFTYVMHLFPKPCAR